MKDIDDMPVLFFKELNNDKEREIFFNEYWKHTISPECNNMEIQDVVDKKQVMLFGRSFDQMQVVDGKIKITIVDPQDILVDRYCDPANLDSSRFLIHTHIFVPLSSLEKNSMYDQEAIERLKIFYATEQGLIKIADNQQMLIEKNQKLADLGLSDVDEPILGETIVELSLHFNYDCPEDSDEEQLFLSVEADSQELLLDKPCEVVIGKTKDNFWRDHYPYNSWASDVEKQDFWSDGVADSLRVPNLVANAWFAQEAEGRTLHNLGMYFYDATKEGFTPQTFNPIAFGFYPVPGKPEDVIKRVDIDPLDSNFEAINFVVGMAEKASGATPTAQGVQTERKITLGEVELIQGEQKERIKGMSKYYTNAWFQRGLKFVKLIEAAGDKLDGVTIHKPGRNSDKIYSKDIEPADYISDYGYGIEVLSQDEKNTKDTATLEKLNALKQNMPDNPKVDEIYKRKLAEFADLTPDELKEVLEYERKKMEMINNPIQDPLMMGQDQVPAGGTGIQDMMGVPPGQPPSAPPQQPGLQLPPGLQG